jgi:hypothetical protein
MNSILTKCSLDLTLPKQRRSNSTCSNCHKNSKKNRKFVHTPPIALQGMKDPKSEKRYCNRLKSCIRDVRDCRIKLDRCVRFHTPFVCQPCVGCMCLNIKWFVLTLLLEPILLPISSLMGIITFFTRLFHCPHGQDCFYTCLELFVEMDDSVGFYFDSGWWRSKKGDLKKDPNFQGAAEYEHKGMSEGAHEV